MRISLPVILVVVAIHSMSLLSTRGGEPKIRVGIIGLDTSHVMAFTKLINDPKAVGDIATMKIVAGFPGGTRDNPSSWDRVPKYTAELRKSGVEIVDSIATLLTKVDAVLVESVDGRPHLEQVRPVLAAGKPVFVDKPCAGSLVDVIVIFELAKKQHVPIFSSSSLRFGPHLLALRNDPKVGAIRGVDVHSPCSLEPHHPDLFWYGVHGVEMLYTLMGTGCKSVVRVHADGSDVVVGAWADGRLGTFRGVRDGSYSYGAVVIGTKGTGLADKYEGYQYLVMEIGKFFKTGKPPVTAEETIELFAFMEAADESKREGGCPVSLERVLTKARAEAAKKL
jgi:predicted dehydrogenase